MQASHKMAEVLYKESQAEASQPAAGPSGEAAEGKKAAAGGGGDEDVVDAEFEETDN